MSGAVTGGVDPAVTPPPGNPRFPLVDALRALAALSVLVFHAAFVSRATEVAWYGQLTGRLEIGVAVFFAISGFLLYRPFVAARLESRPAPRPLRFMRRRLLRIVPAYWLALTVLALLFDLRGVFTGDWWVYYGFGQIYSQDTFGGGIAPAWSLCVEMSFYLLLPLYAAALARLTRGRDRRGTVRLEIAVLAGLALASLALRTAIIHEGSSVIPYTLPGLFDWFAPGMALAVWSAGMAGERRSRGAAAVERRPWLPWLGAGLAFAVLVAAIEPSAPFAAPTEREFFLTNVLSAIVAPLVLMPAVIGEGGGGLVRRVLSLPLLAWLGLISYGIYLWHNPLLFELGEQGVVDDLPGGPFLVLTVLAALISVAVAAASYYGLERPLLRLKDPRGRRAG